MGSETLKKHFNNLFHIMNQALVGFIRGLVYAILGTIAAFIVKNLGASGIFSASTSAIVVAIIGVIDHAFLPTP